MMDALRERRFVFLFIISLASFLPLSFSSLCIPSPSLFCYIIVALVVLASMPSSLLFLISSLILMFTFSPFVLSSLCSVVFFVQGRAQMGVAKLARSSALLPFFFFLDDSAFPSSATIRCVVFCSFPRGRLRCAFDSVVRLARSSL